MPSTTTTESHSLTYPAEGATGWYATWESLMQQITDYMDDITNMRMAIIKDTNGNELVTFTATGSAVNAFTLENAATGNPPVFEAEGEANIGMLLRDSNSNEILTLASTASAVNEVTITNKATGVSPTIQSSGESNIGLDLLDSNGNELVDLVSVASAVNELKITNAATGNPALIETGGETNVGLDIKTKGTGELGLFTNGNEAINVDSAGIVTQPLQSAFHVYNSVTDANVTGNNTTASVEFDTEVFDQNSDYNNSTDTFTAPVSGRYLFTVNVLLDDMTGSASAAVMSLVTSNNTFEAGYYVAPDGGGSQMITMSLVANMDASDTAAVTVSVNGEGSDIVDIFGGSSYTYFSGCLLA